MEYAQTSLSEPSVHLHGCRYCGWIVLAIIFVIFVLLAANGPLVIAQILPIAAVPAALLLWGLRRNDDKSISVDLLAEMACRGFFVSTTVACVLELFTFALAQFELPNCSPAIWSSLRPSLECDVFVAIFMVVCVGLVEEFAKLLPLCKVKTSRQQLPSNCLVCFRVVDSPLAFCLAGCAAGAGFAVCETCSYALPQSEVSTGNILLIRSLMDLPFHVACTGYAAAALSSFYFSPNDSAITCLSWLQCLAIPALLHGVFDSSLTIMGMYGGQIRMSSSGGRVVSWVPVLVCLVFFVISALVWLCMLLLFIVKYKEVRSSSQRRLEEAAAGGGEEGLEAELVAVWEEAAGQTAVTMQ
eukprot:GHVS01086061.1.p1 GENE.GHVS01086061.1~~GHVS01086061.1.p1  ORF type:complete len:356 (+),score=55.77 GHVS01086061.1:221-1288(+)